MIKIIINMQMKKYDHGYADADKEGDEERDTIGDKKVTIKNTMQTTMKTKMIMGMKTGIEHEGADGMKKKRG